MDCTLHLSGRRGLQLIFFLVLGGLSVKYALFTQTSNLLRGCGHDGVYGLFSPNTFLSSFEENPGEGGIYAVLFFSFNFFCVTSYMQKQNYLA